MDGARPLSPRVGIEIGARTLRAVSVESGLRRGVRLVEIDYDPANIAQAIASLRERLGRASHIGVAVNLPHMFAKRIQLPPVTAAEKRRMLLLEPERFFPVRGKELAVATRDGEDRLVFAVDAAPLNAWLTELQALGPVDTIEPAPVAVGRSLARAGVHEGVVAVDANGDGLSVIEMSGARVRHVRRVRNAADGHSAEAPPQAMRAFPKPLPVPNLYLAAFGAALGIGGALDETIAPPDAARGIARRRRRTAGIAAVVFIVALVVAGVSVDAARGRTARALQRDASAMRTQAEDVLAMQSEIQSLDREARAVAAIGGNRVRVLDVLRGVTARLPKSAHVRSLRTDGKDWQISGFATDASRLVPLLEAAPELEGVRFLSATSRTTIDTKSYETFSIGFRATPTP